MQSYPFERPRVTRQVSAENPTGAPGGACTPQHRPNHVVFDDPYKVHPFLQVGAGETVVLADIEGPGCINEMFFTTSHFYQSELVLRIYWDGEDAPSVECPIGAFFANGFDSDKHPVCSAAVCANPRNAYNAYWQMPFRRRARFTLTNDGREKVGCVAYRILYELCDVAQDVLTFHAQYRRAQTTLDRPVYTILDGVKGCGNYVGTYLAWNALSSNWWGEGEVKFYLDGDTRYPTLADNGTEDYFGGAWGFSSFNTDRCENDEQPFSTPYLGMPLARRDNMNGGRRFSLYRWHLLDCVGFSKDIKVTVDTLNCWRKGGFHPLAEDISSVAYWYQSEPHIAFERLPECAMRWDR